MDTNRLSIKRDKNIIIPRALYSTTKESFEQDIKVLEEYYCREDILQVLRLTKENISNQVCELISQRYNTKPFYRYAV
jgi:site-specific recombinase XerD